MRVNRIATAVTVLAAVLPAFLPAHGTTYTWTGGNGSSNSWYSAGNWGGSAVPLDEPPSDYIFAASGWNTAQTTIAIDGASKNPDIQTLTFNANAGAPLTLQIGTDNSLILSPSSSGTTTISVAATGVKHTIAGNSGATIQLSDNQQWSVDGALEISATIWDDGEAPTPGFVKTGAGTLILSGDNSFVGPISIDQGVISVSTIAASQGVACNLGRGSLTLNGGVLLYTGAGPSVSTSRGFMLGAGGGAIDVQNAATSLTFSGPVTGGQAGLTKTGGGALILTGAASYTGLTTICDGALELALSAQNPVLGAAGAGADIEGGKLILDYAPGADPVSAIRDDLLGTKITGSTANPPLICLDDTVTDKVTVESTLYGDADLNGTVNGADLSIVLSNYNKTGMNWSQGDFDGNGTVNGSDLTTVLSNYDQNVRAADEAALSAPEPGSLCMLTLAAFGALAYGRRRAKHEASSAKTPK